MTNTPLPGDDTDLDERERRLRVDVEDARTTLQRAQGHFNRIADELRELRYERRDRAATRQNETAGGAQ
ncbi:hypothetical protein ACPC54_23710 [Kitasatospora sp. NPDC094028]